MKGDPVGFEPMLQIGGTADKQASERLVTLAAADLSQVVQKLRFAIGVGRQVEKQELIKAVVYFPTSSDTNADKDTLKRQIEAVTKYAKAAGFDLIAEYSDDGVKGADTRLSFAAMLYHIASRRRGWRGA